MNVPWLPMMLTKWIPFKTTVSVPKSERVGSGPIEKINLSMVDATKVLIPVSLGKVNTSVAEESMATHIRRDIVELNSKKKNNAMSAYESFTTSYLARYR